MTNSQVRKNKSAQDSATDISTVSLVTDGIVESFLSDWMLRWKISVNHPKSRISKNKERNAKEIRVMSDKWYYEKYITVSHTNDGYAQKIYFICWLDGWKTEKRNIQQTGSHSENGKQKSGRLSLRQRFHLQMYLPLYLDYPTDKEGCEPRSGEIYQICRVCLITGICCRRKDRSDRIIKEI